jgi:hypothetical protein
MKKIWLGNKRLQSGIRHFIWLVISIFLSDWLWRLAVRLVSLPEPYKKIGVVVALISLGVFIWGILRIWFLIRDAGIKGLLIIVGSIFLIIFVIDLLTFPEPIPFQSRIVPSMSKIGKQSWLQWKKLASAIVKAPEEFRFAYVGSTAKSYLPGFPTPDPAINIVVTAKSARNSSAGLITGGYAYLNSSSDVKPACISSLETDSPDPVTFRMKERLLILAGPKQVSAQQGSWWKLHGSQGDGWCKEESMIATR